jgi:hypothetical protein
MKDPKTMQNTSQNISGLFSLVLAALPIVALFASHVSMTATA